MSLNGLALVTLSQAAELGSDLAAYLLGKGFKEGLWGLPMDHVRARFWIKKVVDGDFKYIHGIDIDDAVAMLQELDLLPAAERGGFLNLKSKLHLSFTHVPHAVH